MIDVGKERTYFLPGTYLYGAAKIPKKYLAALRTTVTVTYSQVQYNSECVVGARYLGSLHCDVLIQSLVESPCRSNALMRGS